MAKLTNKLQINYGLIAQQLGTISWDNKILNKYSITHLHGNGLIIQTYELRVQLSKDTLGVQI